MLKPDQIPDEVADAIRHCFHTRGVAKIELAAYYRAEYPGDHPYSQKKLAAAMATNPARAALEGK